MLVVWGLPSLVLFLLRGCRIMGFSITYFAELRAWFQSFYDFPILGKLYFQNKTCHQFSNI